MDGDGHLFPLQVNRFANNVVDKSRLIISSYGGNKGVTYKSKNKFDAAWLLKFIPGNDTGKAINSTI